MTLQGLRLRWHVALSQLKQMAAGPPHGWDPQVDVDRRLTRTRVETVFDVGANRGQSADRLRRWYPAATLHCFEPVAATFAELERHLRGWPRVHTHMIALGASKGRGSIVVVPGDDSSTRIRSGHADGGPAVTIDTLDNVSEELGVSRIDYLKVDTEGLDLAVLQGAARLLSAAAIAIVEVEAGMHRGNELHVGAAAFQDFLEDFGYRLFGVYEQTLEWPAAEAHLRRANLLFISPETISRNKWRSPVGETSPGA